MAFELKLEGVRSMQEEWEGVFKGSGCLCTVLLGGDRSPRSHWTLQNLENSEIEDGNIDPCDSHFM